MVFFIFNNLTLSKGKNLKNFPSQIISFKLSHPIKQFSFISTTESGISILNKLLQYAKASFPIIFKLFGKFICFNPDQFLKFCSTISWHLLLIEIVFLDFLNSFEQFKAKLGLHLKKDIFSKSLHLFPIKIGFPLNITNWILFPDWKSVSLTISTNSGTIIFFNWYIGKYCSHLGSHSTHSKHSDNSWLSKIIFSMLEGIINVCKFVIFCKSFKYNILSPSFTE